MAGTLLLISKKPQDKAANEHRINALVHFINKIFKPHFNRILIKKFDNAVLLVEFRKDEQEKFYMDEQGNWLTFEGTVFAIDKTKAYSAAELLELYKRGRDAFPNLLDGHFVIKLHDASLNRHLVINDILKNKINYITKNEHVILITPLLLTAAVVQKPEVDEDAFNEFMWRYYILSRRSILRNVSKLQEASVYEISSNKITRKSYWDWPKSFTTLSFTDAVNRMTESMKESAHLVYRTFGKPCIDFTMGQDTRQVVSSFRNQKLPFATSIFGDDTFYEVRQTKKYARKYGIDHHTIQLNNDYLDHLWDYFRKALVLGSCEEPGHLLSRILYMRERQKQCGAVICNGQEGHFYKNGLWDEMYTFNFYRGPKAFNKELFYKIRVLSRNYPSGLFTDAFRQVKQNSRNYFSDLIDGQISGYLDRPVSMQVDKFDIYAWLNFENAANNAINIIFNSMSPLYFRRNLELALQIPVKWKFNLSRFQRAVVYNLDRQLAGEKTDFGGVNMKPKNVITYIPFMARYYYFQSRRLRKKVMSKLGFNVITHLQEAWDYLPVYRNLFHDHRMQTIFQKQVFMNSCIEPVPLNTFVHSMKNPGQQTLTNYDILLKIASVEYFLETAFSLWNDVSATPK